MTNLKRGMKGARIGFLCAFISIAEAQAGVVNDVPSCYVATEVSPALPSYDKLVYALIDETVELDSNLKQSVVDNVVRLIAPGTKFAVAEFSAFSQGRYLQVLHTGIVEKSLDAARVNDTPIDAAQNLTRCLRQQIAFAKRMVVSDLVASLSSETSSLDQSDIMHTLKTVSQVVANDNATQKLVFVATDGLENSSISSFYAHGLIRLIDPLRELAKAKSADLFGDFGQAQVYVVGGGTMPPPTRGTRSERNGYRDPKVLYALKAFWTEYFTSSNAQLEEFGEPALISPVSFK